MEKVKNLGSIYEIVKGLIISVIVTMLFVLVFAALIKFCSIDSKYIPAINQVIKSLSIFLGIFIGFTSRRNGWLRGFIFGVLYAILSFVVFSALNSAFVFDLSLLNDSVLGGVTGLISGIIAVNVKKSRQD